MFGGESISKRKSTKKWNRSHEFQYKKATKSTKRHPAYQFAKNKRSVKYFVFTTQPHTDGVDNVPLSHNIDKKDNRISHVRNGWFIAHKDEFEPVTDKTFELNEADIPLIKSLKNKRYKGK